ncbi:MAG: 1-acyl-sn-glycerol-3-phosphate acyltransferase [Acetobacteraceae bacterium]|nr:1-acyl-sn-glycerol-3-phosphate acyltransferase [Acetobacteraceae bacterium]
MMLTRSALFNLYFFALTALLCVVGTVVRLAAPRRVLVVPALWARWALAGLRAICGIRVEVLGREHMPQAGAALLASRHQSAFDTLVWLTLLPRCCYVIKQELRRIPLFGGMIEPAGMILVDREAGASAMRHLMREADRAAREQRQIVIFPEGTRADPGEVRALQPGVAAIAARTGLPVIPVLTDSGRFWGRLAFRKRPGTIRITLLAPIPAGTPRHELMRRLSAALAREPSEPVENSVHQAIAGCGGQSTP